MQYKRYLNPLIGVFTAVLLPSVLLLAAWGLGDYAASLEQTQLAIIAWLPLLAALAGFAVALRFNRIRLLAAIGNLLLVYVLLIWVEPEMAMPGSTMLLALLVLFLPLNHLVAGVLPPHTGVSDLRWMLLAGLGVEALLLLLGAGTGGGVLRQWLTADLLDLVGPDNFAAGDLAALAAGVMVLISFARLYQLINAQRTAFFIASFCYFVLLAQLDDQGLVLAFAAAAAIILGIAAIQETWNLAYIDPLTELPARRALDEMLARLDGHFAIAMLDVDHFKNFNDTHGHDVGDQVLRMVGSQLQEVGAGGKSFRYGGEEFTLVFPGLSAADAAVEVDRLRETIGDAAFEIRRRDRRGEAETTTRSNVRPTIIQITLSAGVAERTDRQTPPVDIIKAADLALYDAKRAGRNQVKLASRRKQ